MARMRFQRTVDAPASVVWDVISDQAHYAEVAPNLTAVEVLDGQGVGMVRRCVDTDGKAWTETCTAWEEGRRFAVTVDVEDSDFHRPLFTRFAGEWGLTETDQGVVITITFEFTPRFGPLGRPITWYLRWKAPAIIEAIFDGWEATIHHRMDADESGRTTNVRGAGEGVAIGGSDD